MSIKGRKTKATADTYEFEYMRTPDTRTGWEKFRDAFYNPVDGAVCGHTKEKWGVTFLFYACFYAVLTALFAICMKGLLASLYKDRPKWILEESLIGTNPGLGFRPMPDNADERSLVWYNAKNSTEIKMWTDRLDLFLDHYINPSKLPNGGRNQETCSFDKPPQPGKVCAVDINSWGRCSSQSGYGFSHSTPCIFIKLNRLYGWVPQYYNDPNDLPADMPEDLVAHIKKQNKTSLDTVWVSCKPENPLDRETIGGLDYYPKIQGFPGYYFPYENVPGYLSPLVAVHFQRPRNNVIINVECRAWAKNIIYGSFRNEKKGAVHFELLIDGDAK